MWAYTQCASSARQIIFQVDKIDISPPDWRQVALDAWSAPSWREAAIEYHRNALGHRLPAPRSSAGSLMPSRHEIWRAAGRCIKRKRSRDALRTFFKWCDHAGVDHSVGLPVFKTIVEKELAK